MAQVSNNPTGTHVQGNQVAASDRTIAGVILRVTFYKEESGYFIVRVQVAGVREEQTVVGTAASITAGEYLEAKGRWEHNPTYGRQFRANEVRLSLPVDKEGIIKFLSSALPGVGKTYARKLVEAFGVDVSYVIENEPHRLSSVPGIGKKRAESIIGLWAERSVNHGILSWLCGLGLSPAFAGKVHKMYGANTKSIITNNPYQLAEDIHGIGFRKADAMAGKIGISPSNPFRIKAALRHLMREATDSGSCGLPRLEVQNDAIELLNFEPEGMNLIDVQINDLLEKLVLVESPVKQVNCLFLAEIYRKEQEIAMELIERVKTDVRYPIPAIDSVILEAEMKLDIALEASQRAAVSMALRESVAVITGGPGTGKTTITRVIVEAFKEAGMRVLVCAPTGKAAKRASEAIGIPASTIHRMLEVKDNRFVHCRDNPLEADAVVVDELSMVDVNLFRSLLLGLAPSTRLILVGDVDQLPSVGPGKVLADIIDSMVIPTSRLTEIFRQARESHIIMNAHRVNGGLPPTLTYTPGADFGFLSFSDDQEAQAALLETAMNLWRPGKFLAGKQFDPLRDVQVLSPMRKGELGVDRLNTELRRRLNPSPDVEIVFRDGKLGTGDKVIQTKNNYTKAVFNGEIGFVTQIIAANRTVTVDFDGRQVEYVSADLDELRLAYALTIHRSQGSEFPVVLMALSWGHFMMLKRNLLYTGITRARELMLIFGDPRATRRAAQDSQVEERYSKLRDWLISEARPPQKAAA